MQLPERWGTADRHVFTRVQENSFAHIAAVPQPWLQVGILLDEGRDKQP